MVDGKEPPKNTCWNHPHMVACTVSAPGLRGVADFVPILRTEGLAEGPKVGCKSGDWSNVKISPMHTHTQTNADINMYEYRYKYV